MHSLSVKKVALARSEVLELRIDARGRPRCRFALSGDLFHRFGGNVSAGHAAGIHLLGRSRCVKPGNLPGQGRFIRRSSSRRTEVVDPDMSRFREFLDRDQVATGDPGSCTNAQGQRREEIWQDMAASFDIGLQPDCSRNMPF